MVLLCLGNEIVAKCKSKATALRYLEHRYGESEIVFQVGQDLKGGKHVMVREDQTDIYHDYVMYSVHKWPSRRAKKKRA